ncbi:hypothetical protein [Candidatus Cardinium hertigii]|uniref:hypothetical protein n=1 Tax=Candidatus Cardinium hertigii TaxID=247481 RepID=UPI003D7D88F9
MHFLGKKVPIFKEPAISGNGPVTAYFLLRSLKDLTFAWPTKLLSFQQHLPPSIKPNVALMGLRYRPISNPCCLVAYIKSKKKYYQRKDRLIENTRKTIAANYEVHRDTVIHIPMRVWDWARIQLFNPKYMQAI